MKLSIQHLRQAFHDGDKNFSQILDHVTKTIVDQIDALSRIASQFSHFARMPERYEEDVDLREVVMDAAKLFEEYNNIRIEYSDNRQPMVVHADREELRRAFINIFRNAVQAMNEGGIITIQLLSENDLYTITVADAGPGVPEEIRGLLFEPNFSTKSEGMGLGLAMVKKTIDDLSGRIEIQSELGKGTKVIIILPKKKKLADG